MREQVQWLEILVGRSAAFEAAADRPVHADLWLDNVLLDSEGGWHLLDWDGLSLGDPVIDWCMLFGPTPERPQQPDVAAVSELIQLDRPQTERLRIYARAALLDWIIDPLADWVAAAQEGKAWRAVANPE